MVIVVVVVGRGGDGWEVDALAAADALRRRLVDVAADSRARKSLRDRSVTGVIVVVVPVLMMMMTAAGRAAAHGRQIFVAVHHESFFGGAIDDGGGGDRRQGEGGVVHERSHGREFDASAAISPQ